MTATSSSPFPTKTSEPLPHGQRRGNGVEKSCRKCSRSGGGQMDRERAWFASLMWRAFPEATSEHELATLVAEVLTTDRVPVHPRTVRNWLRCENAPGFHYTLRILALAGAERVFEILDPEVRT